MPRFWASRGVRTATGRPSHRIVAGVGRQHAADDVHEGRFAGAVFAGEGVHFGGADVEVDAFEHAETAEGFGDAAQLEQAQARLAAVD